jgi:hypothetical protein
VYVIRKRIVAESLARLRKQKTHTLFAGYLYLQRRASQLGRLEDLQPDFLQFFKQFFEVGNHPLGAPYIKPFTEQKASAQNLWLNENVAGSYAPSSLPPDHAQRAFKHLLYSTPVQVADLAVVLYRDFGLRGSSMTIEDLIDTFAYEFGYANDLGSEPDEKFRLLYSLEATKNWAEDWLEAA